MDHRLATPQDVGLFLNLWGRFMKEDFEKGSQVEPCEENLQEYLRLFRSYTEGSLFGLVVLAEDAGTPMAIGMAGENFGGGAEFKTPQGKTAMIWGVWVEPTYRRKGVAFGLQDFSRGLLLEMGFKSASSFVKDHEDAKANAAKMGVVPQGTLIIGTLAECGSEVTK